MPIDPELHASIKNYFTKKYHDGTGGWKEGEKYPAIDLIKDDCKRLGYGWEIVPGLIIIHLGNNNRLWFDRHNQETGTLMTAETKNVWRAMDEGRAIKSYEYLANKLDENSLDFP